MTGYRVHMAGVPAATLIVRAAGYRIDERGLIRFSGPKPHDEGVAFVARNVFAIEPLP